MKVKPEKEHIVFILSHNSKHHTEYVYSELKKQTDNVIVLENSYIPEKKFLNEDTVDFGEKNIGVGGFYDYIIETYSDKDLFVGIFNNDIFDIPSNLIEEASKFFNSNVGIISPSLNDPGCPYPEMFKCGDSYRKVKFVENVCPFYNSKVIGELKSSIPTHYYGWIDVILSKISNFYNFDNIILDSSTVSHIRSGIRKEMESIDNNYSIYSQLAGTSYEEWISSRTQLHKFLN